jgi:hypothetical protein
VVVVWDTSR